MLQRPLEMNSHHKVIQVDCNCTHAVVKKPASRGRAVLTLISELNLASVNMKPELIKKHK